MTIVPIKESMPTLRCRIFHVKLWTMWGVNISESVGRYVWLRCPKCDRAYMFRIRIVADPPPGKTPLKNPAAHKETL